MVALGFALLGLERGWLQSWREASDRDLRVQDEREIGAARATSVPTSVACPICGTVQVVGSFPGKRDSVSQSVRITVRMDDGSFRSFAQPPERGFAVGDRIRVVDGIVVADAT